MLTLEDIEAHYSRMDAPPELSRTSLPVDVLNPGTSRPENHPRPGLPSVDQTMSVTMASASVVSSDGQTQRLDLEPLQGGVTVVEVKNLAPKTSNGQFQSRNLVPLDQGTRSSSGGPHLPTNVNVSNQNLHVVPLEKTEERPPARDVKADDKKPGGVPISVSIK